MLRASVAIAMAGTNTAGVAEHMLKDCRTCAGTRSCGHHASAVSQSKESLTSGTELVPDSSSPMASGRD